MNPTLVAVRGGLAAMWIELRQLYTNGTSLMAQFLTPTLFLLAIFFLRDRTYQDTELSLGELAVPGLLGSIIAFNGLYGIAEVFALDREDGTLLRAKTIRTACWATSSARSVPPRARFSYSWWWC
ncbi:hypothetical protein ACFYO7_11085 [Nocardia salmonicida]|uniref:hypothetical protein n=1 Tax=Nocardia salmonicida TaxID=53431 RepID=UPI0036C6945C